MSESVDAPFRKKNQALLLLVSFTAVALVGTAMTHAAGASAGLVSAAAFAAVVSAALLISWGAEAAQFFLSQGFAVALIALLQVLPEFMVEAVIAWKGEIRNMFANATGSNRLLIGLGWPLIYFTADVSHRLRYGKGVGSVRLRRENILEVISLLVASSYYLKLLAFGSLTLFDGVFLTLMYVGYMVMLSRLPSEDEEEDKGDLLAPPRLLVEIRNPFWKRYSVFGLFVVGAGVMLLVAEPFVEALKHVAAEAGIREFVFIQWLAPFLSEFPEKVTAFYWSRTVRLAPMALLNMISSTVSQFTLLVGMIPIVYALSVLTGNITAADTGLFGLPSVPMYDAAHDLRSEVFLSWAMTLLGCAFLAKLHFTLGNAVTIFVIWLLQFLAGPIEGLVGYTPQQQHWAVGFACIAIAIFQVVRHWGSLEVRQALAETLALVRAGGNAAPPPTVPAAKDEVRQ